MSDITSEDFVQVSASDDFHLEAEPETTVEPQPIASSLKSTDVERNLEAEAEATFLMSALKPKTEENMRQLPEGETKLTAEGETQQPPERDTKQTAEEETQQPPKGETQQLPEGETKQSSEEKTQQRPEKAIQQRPSYPLSSKGVRTLTIEEVRDNRIITDDDDDDFEDETLAERLVGLTEMFPDSLCRVVSMTTKGTVSGVKSLYSLTRGIMWFTASTCVLCFLPLMLELERCQVEEQEAVEQRTMMLGPQASHLGAGPGLAGFSANIPMLSPVGPQ